MNPFRYGKPVTGEHFCNRRTELERLVASIRSGNSLWLYSPRRYGKTSLIKEAFALAANGHESAFIDLYAVSTPEEFAASFLRGISPVIKRMTGGLDKALTWLQRLHSATSLQATIDDAGRPVFSLSPGPAASGRPLLVQEVLSIPERLGLKRKRRVVIACDEFQEVARMPGMEETIRSVIQHQEWTSFLLSGSQRSLLYTMFTDPGRPFFQFADHMSLERIPEPELRAFVAGRFAITGVDVAEATIAEIVEAADGHPHFTQYFAAQAWDVLHAAPGSAAVSSEWKERVVSSLDPVFRMVMDRQSANQRRLIRHLGSHASEDLFSQATRGRHGLGSSSSVAGALKGLVEKDILEKVADGRYRFVNPAFRLWARMRLHGT
jgi:uncharacterized protein